MKTMKKILIMALLVGATASSFGQGAISWANTSSTLITYDPDGAGAGAPVLLPVRTSPQTTYNFGLFLAPIGTVAPYGIDDPNWQQAVAYALNSTAAAGAGRMQNPGTATNTLGFGPGTSVNFIVRAWQTQSGVGDWAAARAEGLLAIATSSLGTLIVGGGAFPIPSAFGIAPGQIPGFAFTIPEPSSLALAGLGAAACFFFRRNTRD